MPSSKSACRVIVAAARGKTAELGCGWGGVARALSKKGCEVTAFEISPLPCWVSWIRGIAVSRKDFFEKDLSRFETVVCYLYPGAMERLKEKFEKEGMPNCVITNTFAIPGWRAAKVVELDDLFRSKIFIYRRGDASGG